MNQVAQFVLGVLDQAVRAALVSGVSKYILTFKECDVAAYDRFPKMVISRGLCCDATPTRTLLSHGSPLGEEMKHK